MTRQDLRRLRYFVAVAEELNFGKAARRLHVSQPPLSQQIRALESDLGVPLFERDRHRVSLTPAGQVYLKHAYSLLSAADAAVQAAQRAAAGEVGELRLGYSASVMYSDLVLSAIGGFRRVCPDVSLVLVEGRTHEHAERLARGDIDLAIVRAPLPAFVDDWPASQRGLVCTERLVLALPAEHPLSAHETVPWLALAGESFVSVSRSQKTALNRVIDGLLAAQGMQPVVAVETWDMASLLGLVSVGAGIAIVPETLSKKYQGAIEFRPLADAAACSELWWLAGRQSPASVERLVTMMVVPQHNTL
ncbi:MAG: LysR substrate-binding domain-containing protein [Lautropia sp.]|nr:LysR substrate-binding domain-containing protein [Lautropia sp.]